MPRLVRTDGTRSRSMPGASTPTPRRPAPTARSARPICNGAAKRRSTKLAAAAGSTRIQMREKNLLTPGEYVRPGGKPLDADLIGDIRIVAENLGWNTPKPPNVGRGGQRGAACRRRAPGLDRVRAAGGRRVRQPLRQFDRGWTGRADRVQPDRGRRVSHAGRAGQGDRRRYPGDAIRPLDRRQPLHHTGRTGRAAGRARAAHTILEIASREFELPRRRSRCARAVSGTRAIRRASRS